jgi:aryl-phospho-beta-D-glucosidase BglC (GH1 family)
MKRKLILPFISAALLFSAHSALSAVESPAVSLVVDVSATLRAVPAWRGVHMAPVKDGYQEEDVIRLKELGATCVRFGFSGMILEGEEVAQASHVHLQASRSRAGRDEPGTYNEEGFHYLDRFIGWCEKHNLGAILDLHNVVGRRKGEDTRIWIYYHGSPDPKIFQDRFVNLWREIARRFAGRRCVLAYELLNEPNPPYDDFEVWNNLAERAIAAIREVDSTHPIIVDSIGYANPGKFRGSKPMDDLNTIYSFHSYQPSAFHEQKRPWDFDVDGETYYYPGWIKGRYWNRAQLRGVIQPAVEFGERHGAPLFCGEFGCVSDCPPMTDMIYLMDQITLFHELGVGWTMFNYMGRESKPYWRSHFDCNLFIYYIPEKKLLRFDRKINFLRFFLEKEGEVLSLDQPSDRDVTMYGIREPCGRVSLLIANKDRFQEKKVHLTITGLDSDAAGLVSVMDMRTDDFEVKGRVGFQEGRAELNLPKLSITKVEIASCSSCPSW